MEWPVDADGKPIQVPYERVKDVPCWRPISREQDSDYNSVTDCLEFQGGYLCRTIVVMSVDHCDGQYVVFRELVEHRHESGSVRQRAVHDLEFHGQRV